MSFYEFPHTRTYDSDVGWLIKNAKTMADAIEALNNWIKKYQPTIDDIVKIWELITSGNLTPEISAAIEKWCREHMPDLVAEMIHSVFFEIDDTGHFIAYIPESWYDVTFNTTGFDIFLEEEPQFGHLVLSY